MSARALELYALNIRLSEALYTPLQMLEVVLRNRIHITLSGVQSPFWFANEVSSWRGIRPIRSRKHSPI
ncbi:hypothetical protein [Rhodopila sp.]|uniref:hypothetical protein n=1 Tax=Rhodopila sp. TaxID=2480087 RepID=UPI003D14A976